MKLYNESIRDIEITTRDVITFQGTSVDELEQAFKEVQKLSLELQEDISKKWLN